MGTGFLRQSFQRTALVSFGLLLFSAGVVNAAKPPSSLSCNISPANGTAIAGVAVTFSASTQGGKGSKSYSWNFSDGNGVPEASVDNRVDVTYTTAGGPFYVYLDVTDKRGEQASCSTTVNVVDGEVTRRHLPMTILTVPAKTWC